MIVTTLWCVSADAQMGWLYRSGEVSLVISTLRFSFTISVKPLNWHLWCGMIGEDSDLFAFGCERVMFKFDRNGSGLVYDLAKMEWSPPASTSSTDDTAPSSSSSSSSSSFSKKKKRGRAGSNGSNSNKSSKQSDRDVIGPFIRAVRAFWQDDTETKHRPRFVEVRTILCVHHWYDMVLSMVMLPH
jgi:hypothetical protein